MFFRKAGTVCLTMAMVCGEGAVLALEETQTMTGRMVMVAGVLRVDLAQNEELNPEWGMNAMITELARRYRRTFRVISEIAVVVATLF